MRSQVEGSAGRRAMRIVAALLAAAPGMFAQTRSAACNAYRPCSGSAQVTPSQGSAPVQILREIRDPHSGARWLVIRNAQNPAGPARITAEIENAQKEPSSMERSGAPSPIIHAGDRVVVEEHSTVAESYLDAVALGAAVTGVVLDLRLKIGGKVVRAVAIAPGRAALAPLREARP